MKFDPCKNLKIQIIASDPEFTFKENLEIEASHIQKSLGSNCLKPEFSFVSDLSPEKVKNEVCKFEPDVINFTSSGSPNQNIKMLSSDGFVRNITGKTLSRVVFPDEFRPKCLFFNNCRVSRGVFDLFRQELNVFGSLYYTDGVDVTKIISTTFYQSLGDSKNFEDAFDNMKEKLNNKYKDDFSSDFFDENTYFKNEKFERLIDSSKSFNDLMFKDDDRYVDRSLINPKQDKILSNNHGPRIYKVFFGTNRKLFDANNIDLGFSSDRGSKVEYGFCDVTIPKYHKIGSLGDVWWKRFPFFWNSNRLSVNKIKILKIEDYWKNINALFGSLATEDRSLLIFLHGYNVTFDQAAIRAAQLGFDLAVRGATAFFSWPSKGTIKGYAADIASIEASEVEIADFITNMANQSGANKVHLIAHSMGNRGVLRAFTPAIENASKRLKAQLNQIFLAAPDVDTELFKRLSNVYSLMSERTTMYVSSNDKALSSSGIIHDYPRAGFAPPITIVDGIDTIEASKVDLSFLGHGYFGNVRPVLSDMHLLMESGTPPQKRFGLESLFDDTGLMYWQLKS